MNELIAINYESEKPTVSGRELHKALGIDTPYHKWFPRMCEYGFTEDADFWTNLSESTGGRPATDHQLTISMAKELCMLQRNEKGKMFRQYFIKIEEAWNSPEMVMKRALDISNALVEKLKTQNFELEAKSAALEQRITEMQPKASYYDIVLNCPELLTATEIAKDYGKSAVWLNNFLAENKVQYKQSGLWLLYQKYAEMGYTSTKTHTYTDPDGSYHCKVHTYWTQKGRLFLYELLKSAGILPIMERENP